MVFECTIQSDYTFLLALISLRLHKHFCMPTPNKLDTFHQSMAVWQPSSGIRQKPPLWLLILCAKQPIATRQTRLSVSIKELASRTMTAVGHSQHTSPHWLPTCAESQKFQHASTIWQHTLGKNFMHWCGNQDCAYKPDKEQDAMMPEIRAVSSLQTIHDVCEFFTEALFLHVAFQRLCGGTVKSDRDAKPATSTWSIFIGKNRTHLQKSACIFHILQTPSKVHNSPLAIPVWRKSAMKQVNMRTTSSPTCFPPKVLKLSYLGVRRLCFWSSKTEPHFYYFFGHTFLQTSLLCDLYNFL